MIARTLAAAGTAVLWSNVVLPRTGFGIRGRTIANAAFATGYCRIFDGRGEWCSTRGLQWGAGAFALTGTVYAAAAAIAPIRDRMAEVVPRAPEVSTAEWVGVHIPLGTVYSEETIFRGTLDPLLAWSLGSAGKWCGPVVFGLWHIRPARTAGDSVIGTVIATTVGGAVFSWLRRRTGGVAAPASAHLALNAGGALAPRLARVLRDR
ncbi:CPBP family intramembrane glutamic endopeptidase [Nocardia vermiculata]|uniref:CPBP family intramembrane metalloprotease n=1 Tax=Nocardia vermiculata TaxID=257274 RepID=A0A846Y2U0_9NOCA|nr:CPBP family intramembrane glutamic endopeptidase [Nocardia vermiculata]NKY53147.1 CPBP family intramembrane metalloprotease [Nocardia vermiculata]